MRQYHRHPPRCESFSSNRVLYWDVLRTLATIGVVMIHTNARIFGKVDITSWAHRVYYLYDALLCWPVSIFIMLSGAIFLDNDRPLSLKTLYRKQILRLVVAWFFWSAVYCFFDFLDGYSWWSIRNSFWAGQVHMWYIPLAVGYYLATPVLRQVTASQKASAYLLLLAVPVLILIPNLISFLRYRFSASTATFTQVLGYWNDLISFGLSGTFLIYYVLGFYLHKYNLPKWSRLLICLCAGLGCLARLYITYGYIRRTQLWDDPVDFTAVKFFLTLGVFFLVKDFLAPWMQKSPFLLEGCRCISKFSFGIYMVHMLVLRYLPTQLGFDVFSFNPLLSVPAMTILVFVESFLISWLLHKIPFLRRCSV